MSTQAMRSLLGALALAALVGIGTIAAGANQATPEAAPTASVVREVLAAGEPEAAPGHTLQLQRIDIPAGSILPTHIHPGMQVAYIVSGVLGYTVLQGEVELHRADGSEEIITAGSEVLIEAGDWIVEPAGMVHAARAVGDEPIVILVSALFVTDAPLATTTNAEGTPTP